jgi:hypothetical protein
MTVEGVRQRDLDGIRSDSATIICDISDEAIEAAAGKKIVAGHYTLYFCTALDLCPGP